MCQFSQFMERMEMYIQLNSNRFLNDILEMTTELILQQFAQEHSLYLDKKGPRTQRNSTRLVWVDLSGAEHELDFVLEKDGTPTQMGTPAAFIEVAWRRYSKHARSTVQGIQGTMLPLAAAYREIGPFTGVVLAGSYTKGALTQLKSSGITVLYFPYDDIVNIFNPRGIEVGEDILLPKSAKGATNWDKLFENVGESVAKDIINAHSKEIAQFLEALKNSVTRTREIFSNLLVNAIRSYIDGDYKSVILYSAISIETVAEIKMDEEYEALLQKNDTNVLRLVTTKIRTGKTVKSDPVYLYLKDRSDFKLILHEQPLYIFKRSLLVEDEQLYQTANKLHKTRNNIVHQGENPTDPKPNSCIPISRKGALEAINCAINVLKWFGVPDAYSFILP